MAAGTILVIVENATQREELVTILHQQGFRVLQPPTIDRRLTRNKGPLSYGFGQKQVRYGVPCFRRPPFVSLLKA